jgi:hypothetical protein
VSILRLVDYGSCSECGGNLANFGIRNGWRIVSCALCLKRYTAHPEDYRSLLPVTGEDTLAPKPASRRKALRDYNPDLFHDPS